MSAPALLPVVEESAPRRWRAIAVGTGALMVAYGLLLAGLVSAAPGRAGGLSHPLIAVAAGLVLLPVVFVVLAVLSEQPSVSRAVVRASGVAFLTGLFVSPLAADAVTGIVAAAGAGGIVALRLDDVHSRKFRVVAVLVACVYAFVLVRTGGPLALVLVPLLPLTGIGLADELAERRHHPHPTIA